MRIILVLILALSLSGCVTFRAKFYKTEQFIDGKIREVEISEVQGVGGKAVSSSGASVEQEPLWRVPDIPLRIEYEEE